MDLWPNAYVATWVSATVVALALVVRDPAAFSLFSRDYARTLFVPWKLVTFAVSAGFFVLAAPYTGDPTWDRIDGGMMSVLTYLTAPWALGTVARRWRYWSGARADLRPSGKALYVAAIAWLVSASWCYDGYLYIRDGRYAATWWSSLAASSILYIFAGLMWSLTDVSGADGVAGRGVVFDFMTDEWLTLPRARFGRIGVFVLLVMIAVSVPLAPFALETWREAQRKPTSRAS